MMEKDVKAPKTIFWASKWYLKHPFADKNTQQIYFQDLIEKEIRVSPEFGDPFVVVSDRV